MLTSGPTGVRLKSELAGHTMAEPVILKMKQAFDEKRFSASWILA